MALPKISDIYELDNDQLEVEIVNLRKELFALRMKKATRQDFKPHMFKHSRHRLSQLLTVQSSRK
jgi:large subunit ribosomal protein L29